MKRALSVLLVMAMMLSCGVYALAAEEPAGDHSHIVSDIYFISGDQVIDLTGVTFELDVTGDAGTKAGRLRVNKDGQTVAELGVTMLEDGLFVLHMESPTLGHKDYGIDPVKVLARMMQSGIDSLTGLLESIDVNEEARRLIDGLMAEDAAPAGEAEEAPEASPAPAMPNITIEGDPMAVIEGCIGEPETVHMGGMEYAPDGGVAEMPEGDYQVQTFNFDTDTVCELLDMVYVDGAPAGLGDELREAGVDVLFAGTCYDNDQAHIAQISGSLSGEDFSFSAGGGYNQLITDEGKKTTYSFGTSSGAAPETMSVFGLGFTVSDGTHEGEPFTPASIDEDEIVVLTGAETDPALEELNQSLSMLAVDMLTPVLEPFMEALEAEMAVIGPEADGEFGQ